MSSNLISKYRGLSARTRIFAGAAVMTYATAALYLSDAAEEPLGLKADEHDNADLKKWIPRVRSVDRAEWELGAGTRSDTQNGNKSP